MPTNFYFQSGASPGTTNEQRLLEDLIIESMKIYGNDVYYLPRTSVSQDDILGEDVLSKFNQAYPIEMYLTNIDGWEGDREIFTKFGIEVRDTATFVVSRRRWEESVRLQAGDDKLQLPARPAEGDLIYFPKTDAMFEIKFVEHKDPFFQLGKFYIYNLQCELFQYSSEKIDTGIDEIDDDFEMHSADVMTHEVLGQSGVAVGLQSGGSLIAQTYTTESSNVLADNEQFEQEGKDILDFSVINPFGEI